MRVAVMGSGAVGGYFGAKLTKSGVDVTLIARGDHLAAIQKSGLTVKSFQGDITVRPRSTADPAEAGQQDLVLFTVKSHGTSSVARLIRPMVGPSTAVLCLQNGVDNEEKIGREVGAEHVLSGVVYIGSEVVEPGVILHESRGEIIFGEQSGAMSERVENVARLFRDAEVPCEPVADIVPRKWQKFLFNCALNAMTAITGCRLSTLMAVPESRRLFQDALTEVEQVARAEGIPLPSDVVSQVMDTADRMDIRSSMQADLEQGRQIELDTFNGHAVGLGKRHGVQTPVNEAFVGLLKAIVEGRSRGD